MPSWKKVITSGSDAALNSINVTNGLTLTGSLNHFGNYNHTGSVNHSGSKFLNGVFVQTGSLSITGSTTQVGNNTLLGTTTLSGSIIISGSTTVPTTPTIKVYGDMETDGVIKFMPVSKNINTSISASYIYVSGSTNDLYFSQNGSGYSNVTRLRWLEGNLYTGLLNGGLISASIGSTIYYISSGSGVVVNLNASYADNPYPVVQYVNWGNLSASIAPLSASYDQSFVAIESDGAIHTQGIPYIDGDYNIKIPIGIILHQNRSTINAYQTFPSVAYGWKQRSFDFIKAFGPLKISGYTLAPSGSSTRGLVLSGGTAWVDGRNYVVDPNMPSYIQEAAGITTSKIFRYRQSGSAGWVYDTNGGAGYTDIDPTNYSLNGTLTPVGSNKWSIQRVFYFPNSATKALFIYYGNAEYATEAEALANVGIEPFSESPNTTANALYIGYMILRNDATFTAPASYEIYQASLFRAGGTGGAGGGGGATALSALSDVLISSPTNGQALVYNSVDGKWQNLSYISASISGNAITATSASFAATASIATSASFASTSSFIITAQTASYVLNAVSASFASTASYVNPLRQDVVITGSLYVSSSNATQFLVGTGSLYVKNDGEVLINTISDWGAYKLQVVGDSYFRGSKMYLAYDGTNSPLNFVIGHLGVSATSGLRLQHDVSSGKSFIDGRNDAGTKYRLVLGNDGSDVFIGADGAASLNVVGTTRNVLINTTTDSGFKLDVNGTSRFSNNMLVTGSVTATSFTGSLSGSATSATSASYAATSSYADNFTVAGTLTAQTIVVQTITSSTNFVTGSTRFGSLLSNTHQFIGSVSITGSLTTTGSVNIAGGVSASGNIYQGGTGNASTVLASNGNTALLTISSTGATINMGRLGAISLLANSTDGGIIMHDGAYLGVSSGTFRIGSNLAANNIIIGNFASSTATINGNTTITGSLNISGSSHTITGSINGNFTGSLFGTSSWANNATTASYALTAQTLLGSVTSASYAATASIATSASYALVAQTLLGSVTSASFVSTASFVNPLVQAVLITGSLNVNAENTNISFYNTAGTQFIGWIGRNSDGALSVNADLADLRLSVGASAGNILLDTTARAAALIRLVSTSGTIVSSSFTVFTGSAVEFQVTNTGVKIGNVITDTHTVTGSLNISGSVTATNFTGSLFGTSSWANNATSASFAPYTGLRTKAGSVANTSFTGNPRKATVTFGTAFADTNYAVVITGEDSRAWSIESKLAGSFVINANSNVGLAGTTYWIATAYGETT